MCWFYREATYNYFRVYHGHFAIDLTANPWSQACTECGKSSQKQHWRLIRTTASIQRCGRITECDASTPKAVIRTAFASSTTSGTRSSPRSYLTLCWKQILCVSLPLECLHYILLSCRTFEYSRLCESNASAASYGGWCLNIGGEIKSQNNKRSPKMIFSGFLRQGVLKPKCVHNILPLPSLDDIF